jgi:serine/threonine-protein kinase
MTELPTTFGKYYLTEKLATGGMAEIYLAKIIGPGGFEKQLVIKQIHPKLTGQRQFVDMFVAEAKTLVTLAHGNIVPVYELGVVEDTYYIAMDYIDGPTLYRLTETMARRESRMEPAVAAWITARIIEGLDYAHRKGEGVIHRDLSPRNVMLSRDGEVKLVDFGIAVTLGEPGEVVGRDEAPTGSFPYMSPEQVRREALTVHTDLFSAGVLMWEMLTGERLFARADADATLHAVQREPIQRPSAVRAEIPPRLDDVVMRALERDIGARWPSASDMLAALNKYLYALDETPGPRDVAALVARFCPPETRRLPTHLEAMAHDVITPDPFAPDHGERVAASGPATAVIPRAPALPSGGPSTAAPPAGRPQRQRSFATNVDLAPILDGTGQLPAFHDEVEAPQARTKEDSPRQLADDTVTDAVPMGSLNKTLPLPVIETPRARESKRLIAVEEPIDKDLAAAGETPRSSRPSKRLIGVEEPIDNDLAALGDEVPAARSALSGGAPPGRGLLVVAGLGALALAAGAVWVFMRGRDQVLHEGEDAALGLPAPADAAAPPDAIALVAPVADAMPAADAPPLEVTRIDGGIRRVDAGATVTPRADAASIDAGIRGTATLTVGADPWGEIYVDGKPVGRTPREVVVPAGHHTVEVVFPAETPPRKQTFAVDLATGETKPIQADFTN